MAQTGFESKVTPTQLKGIENILWEMGQVVQLLEERSSTSKFDHAQHVLSASIANAWLMVRGGIGELDSKSMFDFIHKDFISHIPDYLFRDLYQGSTKGEDVERLIKLRDDLQSAVSPASPKPSERCPKVEKTRSKSSAATKEDLEKDLRELEAIVASAVSFEAEEPVNRAEIMRKKINEAQKMLSEGSQPLDKVIEYIRQHITQSRTDVLWTDDFFSDFYEKVDQKDKLFALRDKLHIAIDPDLSPLPSERCKKLANSELRSDLREDLRTLAFNLNHIKKNYPHDEDTSFLDRFHYRLAYALDSISGEWFTTEDALVVNQVFVNTTLREVKKYLDSFQKKDHFIGKTLEVINKIEHDYEAACKPAEQKEQVEAKRLDI